MPSEGKLATRWILSPQNRDGAFDLAESLGLTGAHGLIIGQLLLNRGISSTETARRYLDPRLSDLRRPDGDLPMAGFADAVERLERAILGNETIGIFGDYDVDGVTSCALLTTFLNQVGARTHARVALRDSGYGFGLGDVAAFSVAGCAVVVTCDCGTSDHEALAAAKQAGIDVIVVDHHQVPDRQPEALALINPHQPSCKFPFKGLASVGVAFYLAAALRTRLSKSALFLERGKKLPDPRELTDLVAVGTIADLAPLTEENRILVHAGLLRLQRNERPGLKALCDVAGLPQGIERPSQVAFRISPRINAPGRLGNAQLALDLMLAPDEATATRLAEECQLANLKRQKIQEQVLKQALEQVETKLAAGRLPQVIVVAGYDWPSGVVGIVAAKLVDRYRRPSLVIALAKNSEPTLPNEGRGSARTIPGFHLYQALKRSEHLLVRYGGHAAAAGLTIEESKIAALDVALSEYFLETFGVNGKPTRELPVDAELELESIDAALAAAIDRMEPFGMGNPEPCFMANNVTLERSRVVGQNHLQVTLRKGSSSCDGIGFNLADRDPGAGSQVNALFIPEIDTFRGNKRVRVRLSDLNNDVGGGS